MNLRVILLFVFYFSVGVSSIFAQRGYRDERDSINGIYIPKDIEDSFRKLNEILPDSLMGSVLNPPISNYDLVMKTIRDSWGLRSGSRLKRYFLRLGFNGADDMAQQIIHKYIWWVNKEPEVWKYFFLQSQEMVSRYGDISFRSFDISNQSILDIKEALNKRDSINHLDISNYSCYPRKLLRFRKTEIIEIFRAFELDLEQAIERMKKYPELRALYFSFNYFREYPENLGELTQLTELDFYFDEIIRLPDSIEKMVNLEFLGVGSCYNMDWEELIVLVLKLPRLRELSLVGNDLERIPEGLASLTDLEKLDLRGNAFSEEQIAELQALMPNTQILCFDSGSECL